MDHSGRYRSRIGRPSGLRPPTVRGAVAEAAGPCPATEGVAPCPAAETASPSRLPRINRSTARLPEPRMQRASSSPRTRAPGPVTAGTPKRIGLRPPASYAATSRLPAAPRSVRTIPRPEPKPKAPIASTVPVARVISPAPRVVSPARTLAVPISQDSPVAAAAVCPAAMATPPRRRIPQSSRLRRPTVKKENMVAIPVVQTPGSPPKRILVPESVAASEQEAIVAVTNFVARNEVDRRFEEMERRLSLEGAVAPCSPRAQTVAVVRPAAVASAARRRIPQPSRLRRPAVKTESMVVIPVVQTPGSPPKRILVPECVAASEQEAIVVVPNVAPINEVNRRYEEMEKRLSLEGATAPSSPMAQTVSSVRYSASLPWEIPPAPSVPQEIMEQEGRKWEAMQRKLSRQALPSPTVECPASPREAAAVIKQVAEFDSEAAAPVSPNAQTIASGPFSLLSPWRNSPAPSVAQETMAQEPQSCAIVEALGSPKEAAAVINEVIEYASEAVINELLEKAEAARAKGIEELHDFVERFVNDPNKPKLPEGVFLKFCTNEVLDYHTQKLKERKLARRRDHFWELYKKHGLEAVEMMKPPPPFNEVLSRRILSKYELKKRWQDLQRVAYEIPLIEDEEMPEYCSLSPGREELSRSPLPESWLPQSSPIVNAPGSPKEAAAVINEVVENAEAARAKGVAEIYDCLMSLVRYPNPPEVPEGFFTKYCTDEVMKYHEKARRENRLAYKRDRFWKLYEEYGIKAVDWIKPPPPFNEVLSRRIPSKYELKQRWQDLQRVAYETPLTEDEEMPEYYSLSSEENIDSYTAFILGATRIPSSIELNEKWDGLQRLAAETRLIEDEEMPEHCALSSEREEFSHRIPPEIDPEAAFVLGAMVETVAQEEESANAEPIVTDLTSSPELVEADGDTVQLKRKPALRLPRPLTPQRVWPSSRRRRRNVSPVLSPIDSPPHLPEAYLRALTGYRSPEHIVDPFRNPPQLPPLYKHLGIKFLDIDELEAFLAGTLEVDEERRVETDEEEEEWANETPNNDFHDRYNTYHSRYKRY